MVFGKHRTDVLVVGAGPVGLFAALRLAEAGVKVQIVDKHWRTGAHSYALALHARSLRLLREAGAADSLIEGGHRVDRIGLWENGNQVAELSLSDVDPDNPFVLVLPQSSLEQELERQLRNRKVQILWNHRVEDVREDSGGLSAGIAQLDQVASGYPIARLDWSVIRTFRERSSYIVAADGYHSRLRDHLGIRYAPMGKLQTFSVFEFDASTETGQEAKILFDDDLTSVMWPMHGKRCRWSFQISHPDQHDATLTRLNEFLKARAPWFPSARGEIHWASMVQFDRRLAGSMGRDRIWLAGDSAHLTSPVGIQSMNAGLVDANDLAACLTEILLRDGSADLLRTYATDRLAELRALYADSPRLSVDDGAPAWARTLGPRIVGCLPATGQALDGMLSSLGLTIGTGSGH